MARAPAVIIIVRHGARLDAADKTWHLSSPTPYDPPLTYGGWTQSRALGTRIASLLHAREQLTNEDHGADGALDGFEHYRFGQTDGVGGSKESQRAQKRQRRKHKVVVHSSPFLRCVQTSIAISAGIAQYHIRPSSARHHSQKGSSANPFRTGSPVLHQIDHKAQRLQAIPEPEDDPTTSVLKKPFGTPRIHRTILRIDAFLGEWLSPDYFDLITPPPNSTMMVASAKAELLRRGEHIDIAEGSTIGKGNFPGGWAKRDATTDTAPNTKAPESDEDPLTDLATIAQALPRRDRASSHSSVGGGGSKSIHKGGSPVSIALKTDSGVYTPPIPAYAISSSDPIPRGYVAHARDACVDVDYHWDSTREPQNWPDGGEYGEEWSAMHKRFRKGLSEMINWYKTHGVGRMAEDGEEAIMETNEEEDDEDSDLVLVLVTHGAGCNALIGALTNQPVLLDVGMASLTMAVRKETTNRNESVRSLNGRSTSSSLKRRSSVDLGLSEEYDMRLVASSEHLRAGVDPSRVPAMPSPKIVPHIPEYRRRYGSHAAAGSSVDASFDIGEPSRSVNSSLGSIRRSSTVVPSSSQSYARSPSGSARAASPSSPGQTGLWSPQSPTIPPAVSPADGASDGSSSPTKDAVLNSTDPNARQKTLHGVSRVQEEDGVAPLPEKLGRSLSQHGLWGATLSGARTEREKGPKRRWTVTEREG